MERLSDYLWGFSPRGLLCNGLALRWQALWLLGARLARLSAVGKGVSCGRMRNTFLLRRRVIFCMVIVAVYKQTIIVMEVRRCVTSFSEPCGVAGYAALQSELMEA